MIVKEELLNQLRRIFNLNLYEVRIWTALLSRGVSTAGELSDIGNVPRSRTYDILESLEKRGFVIMKLGKPIKFIALKPEEVIERSKKNVHEEAKDRVDKLEKLKGSDMLKDITALHQQGIKYFEPTDFSGALRGRNNLYNHLDSLVRNAENDISIVTTEEGLGRKFESLKASLKKAKSRGIKVRIAAPITKKNEKEAKELSKFAEVRHVTSPKARFCIIDGRELLFMIMDDNKVHPNYDTGVWLNTEFFASTLKHLFENMWKTATPLSRAVIK
ncbi:MAG: hypothetical protein KJ767_02485 [Nanoarchaeota archaeon]|nr:hypothetical protein [Nanoarchaeota archaeon]